MSISIQEYALEIISQLQIVFILKCKNEFIPFVDFEKTFAYKSVQNDFGTYGLELGWRLHL